MASKKGQYQKKPLYRRRNKDRRLNEWLAPRSNHYRWERNTKRAKANDQDKGPMRSVKYGRDYAPLYRFLRSRVGEDWDKVHSEAVSRLDSAEPIYRFVAPPGAELRRWISVQKDGWAEGLCVDENNRLVTVNEYLDGEQ